MPMRSTGNNLLKVRARALTALMPPLRLRLSELIEKISVAKGAAPGPGARERIGKKTYIRATGYASEPFDRAMTNARVKGLAHL